MPNKNQTVQLSAKGMYAEVAGFLNDGKYAQALQMLEKLPQELVWKSPVWLNALGVAYRGMGKPMPMGPKKGCK